MLWFTNLDEMREAVRRLLDVAREAARPPAGPIVPMWQWRVPVKPDSTPARRAKREGRKRRRRRKGQRP